MKVSTNSLDATSTKKACPQFLMQQSVNYNKIHKVPSMQAIGHSGFYAQHASSMNAWHHGEPIVYPLLNHKSRGLVRDSPVLQVCIQMWLDLCYNFEDYVHTNHFICLIRKETHFFFEIAKNIGRGMASGTSTPQIRPSDKAFFTFPPSHE